ncbi:hypothetical protein SAMN05661096_03578 [Marivirga sericea]|uniref:HEPN/Toprim N-terminal domain-containing protein n=1 Tax=Marivirga sericea TaxID=1028 RepID=A0A1X7L5P7_9BACT|nr:HEPN/Toprim-associated domain-containing protein [Marivirga sericea]SMG49188.1 hypothetical protein SAMN05661096_03578 [Marivirga sericea]
MGAISEFYISNYPVFTTSKSYYQEVVNLIFLSSDFHVFERSLSERNQLTWGDSYKHEYELEEVKAFCSTAKICKERLELFGASYEKAKANFENVIESLKEDEIYDFLLSEEITYESYLENIKEIITSKLKTSSFDLNSYKSFKDYLQEYELVIEDQNIALSLWSILHVVEPEAKVEYNLTDIIESGWTVDCPSKSVQTEKIIVLTEGKTDTEFLKAGLNKFFPQLEGYYHFMDFETSRYEANASRLVHSIKSFVGSGIKNRIIAIFDNDSAAKKEINNLKKVQLPDNIRVLQYPNIDLAKEYPTIGPTGIQNMDINGLAGSIEMYLGRDCLIEDEKFIPIQWTGYMETIDKYQGVVLQKEHIQKRFRKKVKEFHSVETVADNWKELISIIELMNNTWQ